MDGKSCWRGFSSFSTVFTYNQKDVFDSMHVYLDFFHQDDVDSIPSQESTW